MPAIKDIDAGSHARQHRVDRSSARHHAVAAGDVLSSHVKSLLEGWLLKQGGKGKNDDASTQSGKRNWRKRWFVLNKDELRYYAKPSDKDPKGVLLLAGHELTNVNKAEQSFTLSTGNRDFNAKFGTKADKTKTVSFAKWVSTLEGTIADAQEGFDDAFDHVVEMHATHPDHFSASVNSLFDDMMKEAVASNGYAESMANTSHLTKLGDSDGDPVMRVRSDNELDEDEIEAALEAEMAQPEPEASARPTLSHEERILRAMILYEKRNQIIKETGVDVAADDDLMDAHDDYEEETIQLGQIGAAGGLGLSSRLETDVVA